MDKTIGIFAGHTPKTPGAKIDFLNSEYYYTNIVRNAAIEEIKNKNMHNVITYNAEKDETSDQALIKKHAKILEHESIINVEIHFNSTPPGQRKGDYSSVFYQENIVLMRQLALDFQHDLGLHARRFKHNRTKIYSLPDDDFGHKYFVEDIGGIIVVPLFLDNKNSGAFFRNGDNLKILGKIIGNTIYKFYHDNFSPWKSDFRSQGRREAQTERGI